LKCAGNAWRSNGIIIDVMGGTSSEKRPRGQPRQRWIDIVKSDLKKCVPVSKLEEIVDKDR